MHVQGKWNSVSIGRKVCPLYVRRDNSTRRVVIVQWQSVALETKTKQYDNCRSTPGFYSIIYAKPTGKKIVAEKVRHCVKLVVIKFRMNRVGRSSK